MEKRRSTVAEVAGKPRYMPRHHLEVRVRELLLVLKPPDHRVLLALVLDLRQRKVLLQLILDRRSSLLLTPVVVLRVGEKRRRRDQSEKALIGLVACESERPTAENIKKWTKEAFLEDVGLTATKLLE